MRPLLILLAPYILVTLFSGGLVSWIEGKDASLVRAKGEVSTLEATVSAVEGRAKRAERVASSNEDTAKTLSEQNRRDAVAFDKRLADAREQDQRTAAGREAIARAEGFRAGQEQGSKLAVCETPDIPLRGALKGDVRPRRDPPVPQEIEAAIDAIAPGQTRRARR